MANFLERGALKRAQRQLGAHLDPGETVVEFDIGRMGHTGARVDVVASDRAVYLFDPRARSMTRVPFDEIVELSYHAVGRSATLHLAHISGTAAVIQFSPARRELGRHIVPGVASFDISREQVDGPHGAIDLVCRRMRGEPRWLWSPVPGVERSDELIAWAQALVDQRAAETED